MRLPWIRIWCVIDFRTLGAAHYVRVACGDAHFSGERVLLDMRDLFVPFPFSN